MATKIQLRRGTASSWNISNPILSNGELGYETDTNKFKIGNGVSTWSSLVYFSDILTTLSASAYALEQANIYSASIVNDLRDYADLQITNLIGVAPEALNTLQEIAQALQDNPDVLDLYLTQASASAVYLTQSDASAQYVPISEGGQEYIQDSIQGLFVHENHENIAAIYDDENNKIIMSASVEAVFLGTTDDIEEGLTNLYFTNTRAINSGSATYALLGQAAPSGGFTGQILSKNSNTDYDTIWVDRDTNLINPILLMGA
jgi:hypothetical protein